MNQKKWRWTPSCNVLQLEKLTIQKHKINIPFRKYHYFSCFSAHILNEILECNANEWEKDTVQFTHRLIKWHLFIRIMPLFDLFVWFTCSVFTGQCLFISFSRSIYRFWTNALMIKTMTTMLTTTTATTTIKPTFVLWIDFLFSLLRNKYEHFFLCYQWIVVNDTRWLLFECNTKQNKTKTIKYILSK